MTNSSKRQSRAKSVQSLSELLKRLPDEEEYANLTTDDPVKLSWVDIRHRIRPKEPSIWTRIFRPATFKAWRMDEGKEIVHGILGEIEPGQVIAIMGGTGAGKSTMLNILAGRLSWGQVRGLIRVNGLRRNPVSWHRLTSYVEQKDELDPTLTVQEILHFHTFVKLCSEKYGRAVKERKVKKLMQILELSQVANSRVTSLSDGQKKLLSIGIELARERRLIFLDEPTTGLDSVTSIHIASLLRKLSLKYNLSIVLTIHQPSAEILKLFDKILLLAQGSTVFYGHLDEILDHLIEFTNIEIPPHENPADYSNPWILLVCVMALLVVLDMTNVDWQSRSAREASQKRINDLVLEWKRIEAEYNLVLPAEKQRRFRHGSLHSLLGRTHHGDQLTSNDEVIAAARSSQSSLFFDNEINAKDTKWHKKWPVSYPYEAWLLLKRYSITEVRARNTNILLLVECIIIALFYGFVFFQLTTANFGGFQSRLGLCSQLSRLIFFIITANLGNVFLGTRRLMVKERASHTYRLSAAFITRTLSLLPFRMFCIAVFSTIIYFLAGFRIDTFIPFLIYFFYTQLILISMVGLGLIITSAFDTLGSIVVFTIFIGDIFNVFGGTLVLSPSIPGVLRWIRFLSPFFYCNQALVQNEVSGLVFDGIPGEFYIDLFYQNQISIMWATGGLMITTAGYFLIGYATLFYQTRPKFIVL